MEYCRILPVGDQAVLVEFGSGIDEKTNNRVLALAEQVKSRKIKGIIEMLPTYRSLMIFYDKKRTDYWIIKRKIEKLHIDNLEMPEKAARKIMVPCCYEEEFGPDLSEMQAGLQLSKAEIIRLHSGIDYKVYMLGFLPGFAYLGGLDRRIYMPRLSTPRLKIPAGSVGIGGDQTGVYPMESPGGWRLIGRTPIDFYAPERERPILCQAGDYLRFVPISAEEYASIRKDVEAGNYRIETEGVSLR